MTAIYNGYPSPSPSGFSTWTTYTSIHGDNSSSPVSLSPPSTPSSPDQKFPNNNPWATRSDNSLPSNTGLHHDSNSAAKQAVCEMGIPEQLVQLAIDINHLRHQQEFSDVTELFAFAYDIASSPDLQASLARELGEAERRAEQKATHDQKKSSDDLEEDGMEVEQSCEDVVDGASVTGVSSAEMLEMSGDGRPKASLQDLLVENQKLKHRKLCRICQKTELAVSGITFLPCGHFITCEECAENCDDCPACGKNVMGTVRTFLS